MDLIDVWKQNTTGRRFCKSLVYQTKPSQHHWNLCPYQENFFSWSEILRQTVSTSDHSWSTCLIFWDKSSRLEKIIVIQTTCLYSLSYYFVKFIRNLLIFQSSFLLVRNQAFLKILFSGWCSIWLTSFGYLLHSFIVLPSNRYMNGARLISEHASFAFEIWASCSKVWNCKLNIVSFILYEKQKLSSFVESQDQKFDREYESFRN